MTLRLPDSTQHARIVARLVGPVESIKLPHVPSDWVVYSMGCGVIVEETADRLRRSTERKRWTVDARV